MKSFNETQIRFHKSLMGFLGLIGPVVGRQNILIQIQTKNVQRAMFCNVGFYPGFFRPFRHLQVFWHLFFFQLFAGRHLNRILMIDDTIHLSIFCKRNQIMNLDAGISLRKNLSFFCENIIIITERMYQHRNSSLYFFTSMIP